MKYFNPMFVLASAGIAQTAFAVDVPILNAGFEADFASAGNYPVLVPQNWSTVDPNGILGGGDLTGVLNPTGSLFFPGGAPQGSNVGYIYLSEQIEGGAVSLGQILSSTLLPNTRYRLTVEVGNIASGFGPPPANQFFDLDGFPGYSVQLRAGGVLLAEDLNTLAIPEGQFRTSQVEFTSGSSEPQLGQSLEIRLTNLNMRSSPQHPGIEVDFDDVRLDAAPVPEPVSLLALAPGIGLLLLRKRRTV